MYKAISKFFRIVFMTFHNQSLPCFFIFISSDFFQQSMFSQPYCISHNFHKRALAFKHKKLFLSQYCKFKQQIIISWIKNKSNRFSTFPPSYMWDQKCYYMLIKKGNIVQTGKMLSIVLFWLDKAISQILYPLETQRYQLKHISGTRHYQV